MPMACKLELGRSSLDAIRNIAPLSLRRIRELAAYLTRAPFSLRNSPFSSKSITASSIVSCFPAFALESIRPLPHSQLCLILSPYPQSSSSSPPASATPKPTSPPPVIMWITGAANGPVSPSLRMRLVSSCCRPATILGGSSSSPSFNACRSRPFFPMGIRFRSQRYGGVVSRIYRSLRFFFHGIRALKSFLSSSFCFLSKTLCCFCSGTIHSPFSDSFSPDEFRIALLSYQSKTRLYSSSKSTWADFGKAYDLLMDNCVGKAGTGGAYLVPRTSPSLSLSSLPRNSIPNRIFSSFLA